MKSMLGTGIQRRSAVVTTQALRRVWHATSTTQSEASRKSQDEGGSPKTKEDEKKIDKTAKSMIQLDEEMRRTMENLSGGGGEAALELEGGKPVTMKRAVKENMFRYI